MNLPPLELAQQPVWEATALAAPSSPCRNDPVLWSLSALPRPRVQPERDSVPGRPASVTEKLLEWNLLLSACGLLRHLYSTDQFAKRKILKIPRFLFCFFLPVRYDGTEKGYEAHMVPRWMTRSNKFSCRVKILFPNGHVYSLRAWLSLPPHTSPRPSHSGQDLIPSRKDNGISPLSRFGC